MRLNGFSDKEACSFKIAYVDEKEFFVVHETLLVQPETNISDQGKECIQANKIENNQFVPVVEESVSGIDGCGSDELDANLVNRFLTTDKTRMHESDRESPTLTVVQMEKKKKKKKPPRPCVFCDTMHVRLQEHMKNLHSNEKEVIEACQLPKQKRNAAFQQLRNQGIKKFNSKEMKKESPKFQRCKSAHRGNGKAADLVMCDKCECFISRGYFYKHRRKCSDELTASRPVIASVLSRSTSSLSQEFKSKVIANIKDDQIGLICKSDKEILFFGSRLDEKMKRKRDKELQVINTVKQDMRRIGKLFVKFKSLMINSQESSDVDITSEMLLNRTNFHVLEQALDQCTVSDENDLMSTLKVAYLFLLKRFSKIVRSKYLTEGKDDTADEVRKFLDVLTLNQNTIFGDAEYNINARRQAVLKRPINLPPDEEVSKLRDYLVRNINQLVENPFTMWDSTAYAHLKRPSTMPLDTMEW